MSKLGAQTEQPRSCLHRKYLRPADNRRSIYGGRERFASAGTDAYASNESIIEIQDESAGRREKVFARGDSVIRNCLKDCARNRYRRIFITAKKSRNERHISRYHFPFYIYIFHFSLFYWKNQHVFGHG